jgi:hypothetical protein
VLAISVLASLVLSLALLKCSSRRDFPGTVTLVSPPSPDPPFLHIIFDKGVASGEIPLSHNRGYWFDTAPPDGVCSAAIRGSRLIYRWDRVEIPKLGWHRDRLEYRLLSAAKPRCFSEESALHFWGILVGISLAPLAIGAAFAALVANARERPPTSGT